MATPETPDPQSGADSTVTPDGADTEVAPGGAAEHRPVVTTLRAGLAAMIVGALLLAVGMLATTTSSPQPSCPAGTVLVSKFNFQGGSYVFEKPSGNQGVVTITNGTATGGSWSSTTPVSVVIVKGGPGSKNTAYEPAQNTGTFTNADLPPVGSGNIPDISNIQFCGPKTPPTTTTTASTTTTTSTSTTTRHDHDDTPPRPRRRPPRPGRPAT